MNSTTSPTDLSRADIAFIGGGNMATAIIGGLLRHAPPVGDAALVRRLHQAEADLLDLVVQRLALWQAILTGPRPGQRLPEPPAEPLELPETWLSLSRELNDPAANGAPLERLADTGELALVRLIAQWPRQVEAAASAHEPHRIAFYLYDLAAAFHAHWNRGREEPGLRFVVEGDGDLTRARLALVQAVGFVIGSGLKVFGVKPVEEMR